MIAQLNDMAQIWWQWMGSMSWQVSLLIIIITALDMVIRKWAWPQVRYALWALVFIKLIIPPTWEMPTSIVSWLQPQVEDRISVQIGITNEAVAGGDILLPESNGNKEGAQATWKTWLLAGWIAGMLVFSFLLLRKMMQFRKWRQTQIKGDIFEWHNEFILKIAGKLKLERIPAVVFSKDIKGPAVYGVLKQYLILPEGYMEKLSKERAEHVLIHELCHLKRGDLMVHWFCIALQIVYWFNPLLIWSRRQMRHISEICCDLSVANVLREKTAAYRETLLRTARELFAESIEPGLGFLGIFEEPFRLVPRLKWLEKRSWENRKRRIATTIFATLIMVVFVMPMAGNSQTSDNSYDENSMIEVKDNADFGKENILYEMLLMEADADKKFDFAATDLSVTPVQQSIGMAFVNFKDNITVDGESLKNFGELLEYMQEDPGVNILSVPKIIAAKGSTATMSSGPDMDSSNKPGFKIKILPTQISDNNYITQHFELDIIEGEGDPKKIKTINTTLMVNDGDTVMISGIIYEDASSSDRIQKNIYLFFTPHINKIDNLSKEDDDFNLRNSGKKPPMVSMDFDNVDIKLFIKFISGLTGKNFIVDKDVRGNVTVMAPAKLTVEEAYKTFESVLEINGYTVIPSGKVIKIVKANMDT